MCARNKETVELFSVQNHNTYSEVLKFLKVLKEGSNMVEGKSDTKPAGGGATPSEALAVPAKAGPEKMNIIETYDLTKIYNGKIRAVDGVNFSVKEGEIFGFLGPNGAGKTTTIKMLITLIKPTAAQQSWLNVMLPKIKMKLEI